MSEQIDVPKLILGELQKYKGLVINRHLHESMKLAVAGMLANLPYGTSVPIYAIAIVEDATNVGIVILTAATEEMMKRKISDLKRDHMRVHI